MTDAENCPTGFNCTPSDPAPFHFTDSGCQEFTKEVCDVSAPCDEHFSLCNTATLTENDAKQERTSNEVCVDIFSGTCPSGCTQTIIGYWRTRAGFTGNNAERVTPLLPQSLGSLIVTTAQQAVDILNFKGSNGIADASSAINKLNAQLLGAKLNIASGADSSAVASTITAADAFLSTHNSTSWNSLTRVKKNQVLSWMTTLDNYNNGLTGPEHRG